MLVVGPADKTDVEHVVRLAAKAMPLDELPAAQCWVAKDLDQQEIVAFAMASREPACESHLLALAVDHSRRGQGLGAELLRQIRTAMRQDGAKRLVLDVRASNTGAQGFYVRQGFEPEGLQRHAYLDGEDAIRYARPL